MSNHHNTRTIEDDEEYESYLEDPSERYDEDDSDQDDDSSFDIDDYDEDY